MPRSKSAKSSQANNNNKIFNYMTNGTIAAEIHNQPIRPSFTVADGEFQSIAKSLSKPNTNPSIDLQKSLQLYQENGNVDNLLTTIVNACSLIGNTVTTNTENIIKIAESMDENLTTLENICEELNDEVTKLNSKHNTYVEANENDKQEMKVKNDIRYFKSQMTVFLKNDDRLKNLTNNETIGEAEKIITEQGLSLNRAYITKAYVLSGMKRINNINKFTRYMYIHFSDSFTSERLIMEMIQNNKKDTNSRHPDVIFSQPTSYDIRRVKSICHDLQADGSISKVFIGDDSIKVVLKKENPNDANEKPKKRYIRNFCDIDALRKDVSAKNSHVPTKTFYNSEYWKEKRSFTKRKLSALDSEDSGDIQLSQKKQRTVRASVPATPSGNASKESLDISFDSIIEA